MKMSQGDNFRMHWRRTTNWKEGGESYYNSQSLQWCRGKENHMLTINIQSCQQCLMCWCQQCIGLVGKGTFQLHKTCGVGRPTCCFGAEHPQPDAFAHSWISARFNFSATPKRGCWRIFGWFWNTTCKEGILAAACLSSLGTQSRALEQLRDSLEEKNGEPGSLSGRARTKEPLVIVNLDYQISSIAFTLITKCWRCTEKEDTLSQALKKKKKWQNWFLFLKKCYIFKLSFPKLWHRIYHDFFWQVAASLGSPSITQPSMASAQYESQYDSPLCPVHRSGRQQAARGMGGASSLRVHNSLLNRPGMSL